MNDSVHGIKHVNAQRKFHISDKSSSSLKQAPVFSITRSHRLLRFQFIVLDSHLSQACVPSSTIIRLNLNGTREIQLPV